MKIENQVCSLEQAKYLKELGVITQSYFAYQGSTDHDPDLKSDDGKDYPAFTVAELGVMLPSETLTIRRGSEDSAFPNWEWENEAEQKGCGCYENEAEARADHLIILLEHNKTTVAEVNARIISS